MNRKTLKTIQNIAAAEIGRDDAKKLYADRSDFIRDNGAWISRTTSALFII